MQSAHAISRVEPLRTGSFRLDGGGMFGLIPKTMWSQWTEADALNRIALAARSLLVESRDGLVLVEAGYGDKWTDRERAMYDLERRTAVDALAELVGAAKLAVEVAKKYASFADAEKALQVRLMEWALEPTHDLPTKPRARGPFSSSPCAVLTYQ